MPAKQLHFGTTARGDIQRGIDKLANAAKITLGPRGRKVSRTALQHAASVVGLLLTTEVLIADAPEALTIHHDGMVYRRGSMDF
jgi:chaperonin GroEL (HSP60 family)